MSAAAKPEVRTAVEDALIDAAFTLRTAAICLMEGGSASWTHAAEGARKALDSLSLGKWLISEIVPHQCIAVTEGALKGHCNFCCRRLRAEVPDAW